MTQSDHSHQIQWIGLFLGPILGALCCVSLPSTYGPANSVTARSSEEQGAAHDADTSPAAPAMDRAAPLQEQREFTWAGRATLAVAIWMGVWWLTEAIEISATALLPIVLFPLFGIASIRVACMPYADPLIFLYFGGFVIALSMERWNLGKRIALQTLKRVGTSAASMVGGFMLVTAVLSAFVSNTATTAMLLPIAMSVIGLLGKGPQGSTSMSDSESARFAPCLLLGIAYSASVGGIATIIGTPPNAFLIGFLRETISPAYRREISFAGWLPIGLSLVVLFLPLIHFSLTRIVFPIQGVQIAGGQNLVDMELKSLGRVRRGEWNTLVVFAITVGFWLIRPLISQWEIAISSWELRPFSGLTDSGIAMTAALCLFLIPVDWRARVFTMDWPTASRMPWGVLILFGGGLSLAAAIQANGVAEFIGSQASLIAWLPPIVVIIIVTAAIVLLTELSSNAATTSSLIPVLAALAPGLGIPPYLLIVPATMAASCAFMLPVATPPNAIVFGSGYVTIQQMVRAGWLLNIIAIVLITLVTMIVVKPWLGV